MKCSIAGCGLCQSKNRPNLTFHRLPRNESRKRKWLESAGLENVRPGTKDIYVCSLHFEESAFNKTLNIIKLRDDACPTIFALSKAESKKNTVPTPRVSKRLRTKKEDKSVLESVEKTKEEISENNSMGAEKKVHFNCPKCDKSFPMYFQTLKHIQRKHPEENEGISTLPDTPDVLPICSDLSPEAPARSQYICTACDKVSTSVFEHNKHVVSLHHNNVDGMFFKTMEEFNLWKQQMETQVKIKYMTFNNAQQIYQCNYVSTKNESHKTFLCPSVISIKDIFNGYQVLYYKNHCGHKTPDYTVPQEFSSNFIKTVPVKPKKEDDLYIKLQKLLSSIAKDAAKVSIPHLKKLYKTAQDMQTIIDDYEEDDDRDPVVKNMSDDQISNALEQKVQDTDDKSTVEVERKRTSARLKRKSESCPLVDSKKIKEVTEHKHSEKLDKTFKENVESKVRPTLNSPSFNDSYKEFVEKEDKKKEIVKTKMGQFVPKSPESRLQILKPSITNKPIKDVKYEVREQDNDCNILVLKI